MRRFLKNLFRNVRTTSKASEGKPSAPQRKSKLSIEFLENRLCPATFNATTVAALITDIATADADGQAANTINLTGSGPYLLTSVNNTKNGPNGLPVISSRVASTLTINGEGNTIQRDFVAGVPSFRF